MRKFFNLTVALLLLASFVIAIIGPSSFGGIESTIWLFFLLSPLLLSSILLFKNFFQNIDSAPINSGVVFLFSGLLVALFALLIASFLDNPDSWIWKIPGVILCLSVILLLIGCVKVISSLFLKK